MGADWAILSLREAGVSLIDCDHRTPPPAERGYPYIAIPQIKQGRLDLTDVRHITREHFVDWTRKARPQPYDVILSRRCNPGETAFVPPDLECALGQNLVLLRADGSKVHVPFLRWLVRSPEWWEQVGRFINVGAVFDSLKCADVPNFELLIPPLPEQRAIAGLLGALDDKVESNRRMNDTLESLAKALFKARIHGAIQDGLPKGWRTGNLGESLSVIETGGRPKGGVGHITEGVPSVGAESIVGIGRFDFSKTKYVPREFFGSMTKGHVSSGDVLLYKDGGRPGEFEPHVTMVGDGFPFDDFCINEHVYRLRTDPSLPQSYLYFWLSSDGTMEEMRNRGTGVAIPGLNSTQVRELSIVLPPAHVLTEFDQKVSPLIRRIFANCNESRTLAALRDALLPKLLSGEVRVSAVAGASARQEGVNV